MSRGIQLGNDPDSSPKAILNNFSGLLRSVGLFRGMGSVLSDFRMRVEYEREGILIHDVPVENTELVVHHGIDCLQDQVERQEMPGSVNHEASIRKSRLIFDGDW